MKVPAYQAAHDLLISAVSGTAERYHPEWKAIARGANTLVSDSGFDPQGHTVPGLIRTKLRNGGGAEATVLREGANAPFNETGSGIAASKNRVLALKTLRHLYYNESFGQQRIWILSLPETLRSYPMEYANRDQAFLDRLLNLDNEKFGDADRQGLAVAAQLALAWVHKAMMVAGAPFQPEHRKLFRRWFIPAGLPGEMVRMANFAKTLHVTLQKIAAGLKNGAIIVTDSPHNRSSVEDPSEAFVHLGLEVMVIYVEKAFFLPKNFLSGRANWARIFVHELSHLYAMTEDYSYAWQGLLPRQTDILKKANDAAESKFSKFPTVRTLGFEQCMQNADSWAFFIADCAGALSFRDRAQALGKGVYDYAGEAMEEPLIDSMKHRIGMK